MDCCEILEGVVTRACSAHGDECPDRVIVRAADGSYRLPVRDGGSSYFPVNHCPWHGTTLPVQFDLD